MRCKNSNNNNNNSYNNKDNINYKNKNNLSHLHPVFFFMFLSNLIFFSGMIGVKILIDI